MFKKCDLRPFHEDVKMSSANTPTQAFHIAHPLISKTTAKWFLESHEDV